MTPERIRAGGPALIVASLAAMVAWNAHLTHRTGSMKGDVEIAVSNAKEAESRAKEAESRAKEAETDLRIAEQNNVLLHGASFADRVTAKGDIKGNGKRLDALEAAQLSLDARVRSLEAEP